jgi:hypothetical protein
MCHNINLSIKQHERPGLLNRYTNKLRVFESRQEQDFSLTHSVQTDSGAHPTSYPVHTGCDSTVVKRPGREADHSPPFPHTSSWCGAYLSRGINLPFFTFIKQQDAWMRNCRLYVPVYTQTHINIPAFYVLPVTISSAVIKTAFEPFNANSNSCRALFCSRGMPSDVNASTSGKAVWPV